MWIRRIHMAFKNTARLFLSRTTLKVSQSLLINLHFTAVTEVSGWADL